MIKLSVKLFMITLMIAVLVFMMLKTWMKTNEIINRNKYKVSSPSYQEERYFKIYLLLKKKYNFNTQLTILSLKVWLNRPSIRILNSAIPKQNL